MNRKAVVLEGLQLFGAFVLTSLAVSLTVPHPPLSRDVQLSVEAPKRLAAFAEASDVAISLRNGNCVVIDTRPLQEFLTKRVPGSIHVSQVAKLTANSKWELQQKPIVVLCETGECYVGFYALLRELKVAKSISMLRGGMKHWLLAGLPSERDSNWLGP